MKQEIERKFLVSSAIYKSLATCSLVIKQGYLSSIPERIVRIRVNDKMGLLTVKGMPASGRFGRFEWEKEIGIEEANTLLQLCEPGVIDKTRYMVPNGNVTIEVDEFHGENEGLVVAEIELQSEDQQFEKPDWLGIEVTGERKYYNSRLVKHPYSTWVE